MATTIDLSALVVSWFRDAKHVEELPPDDPELASLKRRGDAFTNGVELLRSVFPNPHINKLMGMVWDLVGHKIVPVASGAPVAVLSVAVVRERDTGQLVARIFMPDNWIAMIDSNPFYQLGALVFVGSQAVDFYNDKITSQESYKDTVTRAQAHEAEYLLTVSKEPGDWKPNEYQKDVMARFPRGLGTPRIKKLLYTPKDILLA